MIETKTERIWLEDGIMRCVNKTSESHGIEDAIENVLAADKISNGSSYLMIADIRKVKRVSLEARKYYTSKANKNVIACVFLVSSPVSSIIGRVFLGINRPSFPVWLTRTEDEAIKWLKKQERLV